MIKASSLKISLGLILLCSQAVAQEAASSETIVLSLKTMGKALASCKETYTRVQPGATSPLLKMAVGAGDYDKTIGVLDTAEKSTEFLIEHPDRIKGWLLVGILSSSDDVSVSVGATKDKIFAVLLSGDAKVSSQLDHLTATSLNLSACQKSLFNAGDDYVDLVFRAEDRLIEASKPER